MPKRRANGEGNIRKRKDGRWEGRYTVDHDPETSKAIIKNVLGKTQAEVKEKLKRAIEENVGIDYGRAKSYTVPQDSGDRYGGSARNIGAMIRNHIKTIHIKRACRRKKILRQVLFVSKYIIFGGRNSTFRM